jgi:hypothetical protein
MTSRLHKNWLLVGILGAGILSWPAVAAGQTARKIAAIMEQDGRVVYTNIPTAPTVSNAPRPTTPFDALIDNISARHGVDSRLVRAVIEVESNFDRHAVSPKGARGLMQLIPSTGARFGVSDPFDPAQNIDGGVRYLRFLLEMFDGNLSLSLAAYNSGENRVARLGRIPQIRETQDYVGKVYAALERMGGTALTPTPGSIGRIAQAQAAPSRIAEGGTNGARVFPTVSAISRTVNEAGVFTFTNIGAYR